MKATYNNPPTLTSSIGASFVLGIIIAGLLFLLLPLTQLIEGAKHKTNTDISSIVQPPPPPPPPEMEPPKEQVEDDEMDKMEEPPPPPSLAMLELSLDADLGGISAGDIAIQSFDVSEAIEEMIFSIRDLDEPPQYKVTKDPNYPPDLKRAGIEGQVTIECIIDERGNVVAPRVHQTTNQGFNNAALKAVRKWKLSPGRVDGKPVKFRVRIPMNFTITK